MSNKRRATGPRPLPVQRQQTTTKPAGCLIQVPLSGQMIACCDVPFPGWTCPHALGGAA